MSHDSQKRQQSTRGKCARRTYRTASRGTSCLRDWAGTLILLLLLLRRLIRRRGTIVLSLPRRHGFTRFLLLRRPTATATIAGGGTPRSLTSKLRRYGRCWVVAVILWLSRLHSWNKMKEKQSIKQSINQSKNQTIDRSINQSINQRINQ